MTAMSEPGRQPTVEGVGTGRSGAVALIVSGRETRAADDPFFGRVLGGVMSVFGPLGLRVPLKLAGDADARAQLVAELKQGQFDGALAISLHPRDDFPRRLVEAGVPAVLFGRPAEPLPISFVDLDHQMAATLAADRLVDHGCRCVATITGSLDMPAGQDRLSAFRAAMAHRGVAYVPSVEGSYTRESGERAMERLLDEVPGVDGVFVANDIMAQGALLVLRERGRRVPADIVVVGFDDSSAALASRPPLTTVRQPVEAMAAEMARMLLAQLDGTVSGTRSVIFQPTLVQRLSA
jgi:DNA-binding LacI/PurR family transcriptional regulator